MTPYITLQLQSISLFIAQVLSSSSASSSNVFQELSPLAKNQTRKRKMVKKYTKESRVIKLTSISDVERTKAPSRDTARKLLRSDKFSMNYHISTARVSVTLSFRYTSETLTMISHVFCIQLRHRRIELWWSFVIILVRLIIYCSRPIFSRGQVNNIP